MAVTGGVVERYATGGPKVSFTTAVAVVAGQLVEVVGNMTIQPAPANSRKVIGQVLQTGDAVGDLVTVQCFGDVLELIAAGAIAAGDELTSAAAGTVAVLAAAGAAYVQAEANNGRAIVGIALEAIGNGLKGRVMVTGA
jgi:hypothetical protein